MVGGVGGGDGVDVGEGGMWWKREGCERCGN